MPTLATRLSAPHDHKPDPDLGYLGDLGYLEANSHCPEVQAVIREAILRGRIRVMPFPGDPGRVRVVLVRPAGKAGGGG